MIRGGMTVQVRGWSGIAFYVHKARKGRAEVIMVGDDRTHKVDVDDCTPLPRNDYCAVCGQIGCSHDGLVR